MKVNDVLRLLTGMAPVKTAESWDNVGLLCGDGNRSVSRILVSLDATLEVIKEAKAKHCDLIVTHHPLIFGGIKRLTADTVIGKKLMLLNENGISVISMHTNLDVAEDGVNDALAAQLKLKDTELLHCTYEKRYQVITVFVPTGYESKVKRAMFAAGAGDYGKYGGCAFSAAGMGSFVPKEGATPFIGKAGKAERTEESRIEMICPKESVGEVVQAMKKTHPYEVPAFYLSDTDEPMQRLGLGRIGTLPSSMQQTEFLQYVKERLKCEGLRYCGGAKTISRIAVAGGACGEFAREAFDKGADAYITADLKYHDFLDFEEQGYFVVDAGHYETEQTVIRPLAKRLEQAFPAAAVLLTTRHRDAVRFI